MRSLICSSLKWVNDRYPNGLLHGWMFPYLYRFREGLTLYAHYRRFVRRCFGIEEPTKMPPFAAEAYQFVWVLILVVLVISSPSRLSAWIGLFRVYDIAIFSLCWILIDLRPLHDAKRSLAGFMANLLEIVVLFAVASMGFGCVNNATRWSAIYNSLRTAVTVGPSMGETSDRCTLLIAVELAVAYTLTVIVIAHLAGALRRDGNERESSE